MSFFAPPSPPAAAPLARGFYATAWRWHFYAGLYVVPFLLMLALTGLVMVFFTGFQDRLGWTVKVVPQAEAQAVTVQAQAVFTRFPQASLKEYVAPRGPDAPSWFVVKHQDTTEAIAVNPYTADILKVVDKEHTLFAWAERIHGTLLIGDVGDRLIEVAAGLGIVMIVSGLYLWWPRGDTAWTQVLVPNLRARGRAWWKSLHASVGFWLSAVLLGFLLTGLSWTGVWGSQLMQPWGSFPDTKWDNVPTSDATHASLNPDGLHEVPWGLEQTRLPASGSTAGTPGVPADQPVNLDGVARLALTLGFTGQHHIQVPQAADGVYTLSADSMSGDLRNPWGDRTLHVDRYTGRVLAEARFADYPLMGKVMAVGIALHQGDLGLWSAWLNVLFCSGVAFLCVSGTVMWWKRRPAGAGRLAAPPVPQDTARWKTGALVMLVTSLAFPLSGAVLLGVLVLDWLVVSRLPGVKTALS
ncbi:MAG: PepSY domain-containing protein [Hydrogenophaga sp.]|uniref:PepSY-associated TM helix domain-containing protein n=1 Tax=Hydrogenophaga sp. TaxID=1904254 RepID=UPI0025C7354F|nr:PepSY domain-containing protein [Hydrogenophaga sp.]MBT9550990.1 PepSY domain-containing protein [Hydrogenophaga sp.]